MAARGLEICLAVFRSIPVVFITAIIVWSYYAYVVQMCIFAMNFIPQQVIYILLYHPILIMFCWSYWKTIFTPVGTPSPEFYLFETQLEQFELATDRAEKNEILNQAARDLPVYCRTNAGEMRYCVPCKLIKPDRAHHCSICGKCILKMDHHCPWVNNCVGYSNYKFFVLFLFYGLLYTLYVGGTSLQFFIIFWSGIGSTGSTDLSNLHIVFVFFAAVMFAISLAFLLGYHCFLLSRNRTTLEALHSPYFVGGPDKNGFNLGCRTNFLEVFGTSRLDWFLPRCTSLGTGMSFPTRTSLLSVSTYHTMDSTVSMAQAAVVSNGDAVVPASAEYQADETGLSTSKLIGSDQEDQWPNSVDLPPV